MGKLNVEDLKSGMVLAGDLVDTTGRFLIPRGTVIEEKHLRVMKSWGITEADVRTVDTAAAASDLHSGIDPGLVTRCEDCVAPFFLNSNLHHEMMREMRRLSVLDLVKKCAAGHPFPERADSHPCADAEKARREKVLSPDSLMSDIRLASFPEVYYQIEEALNNPHSSASHLADIIAKDTSLSAKLLKVANSALYGLPSKVDTIAKAITFIGTEEIAMLTAGILATRFFKGIPDRFVDMESFWTHSVACGAFASFLAQFEKGLSEERFFVAGLLHDIGRLVMFLGLPQNMALVMDDSKGGTQPLFTSERERLGFDHADVGGALAQKWEFPPALQHAVRYHH